VRQPGAPQGGVDLRIAQCADKLAVVNWLHSKQGPQVHCVALAPISALTKRVNAEFGTINSTKLQSPRYLCESMFGTAFAGNRHCIHVSAPRQFRGFAGRAPLPLMDRLELKLSMECFGGASTQTLISSFWFHKAEIPLKDPGPKGFHRAGSLGRSYDSI
jgi:hypothetical protein